jgi:DNA-binding MarR family transcriptional regulator
MSEDQARLANLLGAFANAISDRIRNAVAERIDLGGEAAAALIILGHEPGLSIDQLGKILRLSHPGAVRVVDRLVAAGFAERKASTVDRRFLSLQLTDSGKKERALVLEGRRIVLAPMLDLVAPEDLPIMERVIEKMLVSLPTDATTAMSVCRYCNQEQCPNCPMDQFGSVAGSGRH